MPGLNGAMKFLAALAVAARLLGAPQQAAEETATIRMRTAILGTAGGIDAAARLKAKWTPEQNALTAEDARLKAERERVERENKRPLGWWPWTRASSRRSRKKLTAEFQRD